MISERNLICIIGDSLVQSLYCDFSIAVHPLFIHDHYGPQLNTLGIKRKLTKDGVSSKHRSEGLMEIFAAYLFINASRQARCPFYRSGAQ